MDFAGIVDIALPVIYVLVGAVLSIGIGVV